MLRGLASRADAFKAAACWCLVAHSLEVLDHPAGQRLRRARSHVSRAVPSSRSALSQRLKRRLRHKSWSDCLACSLRAHRWCTASGDRTEVPEILYCGTWGMIY